MSSGAVEEDTSPGHPEVVSSNTCSLIDEGQRCNHPATSATFNKRLIKTTLQRKRQLFPDPQVYLRIFSSSLRSVREAEPV